MIIENIIYSFYSIFLKKNFFEMFKEKLVFCSFYFFFKEFVEWYEYVNCIYKLWICVFCYLGTLGGRFYYFIYRYDDY